MSNAAAFAATGTEGPAATSVIDPTVECAVAPEQPTVEQAHQIMQTHLRCRTAMCERRRAALAVLVATGRYVLP